MSELAVWRRSLSDDNERSSAEPLRGHRFGIPPRIIGLHDRRPRLQLFHAEPAREVLKLASAKGALLDAAKTAVLRHELNRTPTRELFFEVLAEVEKGQRT